MSHDHLLDRVVAAVGDQYLIEGELGRGGMAVVYRALDLRLQRRVALKVLPPELSFHSDVRERFLREAQTAAQLSHPNIVPIFSVDERGGVVYFVMALVEGETVGQLMKREPRRPVEEVRRVLRDVADALAYAHRHGVIHRDVKPDNIIVDRASGRPMVTDFGIARAAAADSRLTVTGIAVGTPTYMSPEQALGEREIDGRSDIYSLGVVGWQMLAGEPPFAASNAPALLMKHVSDPPPALGPLRPDAPAPLTGAIMRALAKKAHDRWKDGEAFRDAVAGIGAPGAVAAAFATKAAQPVPPPPAPPVSSSLRPEGAGFWPALPPVPEPPPRFPMAPAGLSPREQRHWVRAQQRAAREQAKRQGDFDRRPIGERIVVFRRKLAGNAVTIAALAGLNMLVSPDFLWFLFPAAAATVDVLSKGGSLWADGVKWGDVFGRQRLREAAAARARADGLLAAANAEASLATPEVLAGPQGPVIRRAVADRRAVDEVLAAMGPAERAMIPEVAPTAQALLERVAGLATMLHRLGVEGEGRSLASVDSRLVQLRAEPESTERDRRLELLERQRTSLIQLTARHDALVGQLESAVLALENLKLELLKLRSAGLSAGLDEATSATQAARALSRDIGRAVEAAEDVRKI